MLNFYSSIHSGDPDLLRSGPFPPRRARSGHPDLRWGVAARSPPNPVPPDLRTAVLQSHHLHPHCVRQLPQQCVGRAATTATATRRRHLPAALPLSGLGKGGRGPVGSEGAPPDMCWENDYSCTTPRLHHIDMVSTISAPNVFVCSPPVHHRTGWRDWRLRKCHHWPPCKRYRSPPLGSIPKEGGTCILWETFTGFTQWADVLITVAVTAEVSEGPVNSADGRGKSAFFCTQFL